MKVDELEGKRVDQLFLRAEKELETALSVCSFLGVIKERSMKIALERINQVRSLIEEADKALAECITIASTEDHK